MENERLSINDEALETLLANIASQLKARKAFLSCAESCTGGHISHLITLSPELSKQYNGSVISYSPDLKSCLLDVSEDAIKEEEAVNEQCAKQMLRGVLRQCKSDYGIAVTGFAGPDGGTDVNPVGTIWIAVGNAHSMRTKRYVFGKDRKENITHFAQAALSELYKFLKKDKNLQSVQSGPA